MTGKGTWPRVQRGVLSAGIRCVGGGLVARDRWLDRIKAGRGTGVSERVWIASGRKRLDAVYVLPPQGVQVRSAVLICHGIGEVVEHWARAQELLAERGVATLVFNYSGCGKSRGGFDVERCERDTVAAFWWLRDRLPDVEVRLLGFSLGSGVAVAVTRKIPVAGLILCEAYSTFREAVRSAGAPAWTCHVVPDIWRSEETLRECTVPVLVVHGDQDRLFPVSMGGRLARAAGERGKFIVVPGMGHADLHAEARVQHWEPILERVCAVCPELEKSEMKA